MKSITSILFILLALSACSKQLTKENLYDKCRHKTEQSILNYIVQFQVLEDISSAQLVGLFDDKLSSAESVDLCQCFVTKFKAQSEEMQSEAIFKVQAIDEQLKEELKLFAKNGLLGKLSHLDSYERVESFIPQLTDVKKLIEESSRNKFHDHACL